MNCSTGVRMVLRGFILLFFIPLCLLSQPKFTKEDYKRALWMTTRFYGAQRSGAGPNWLLMEHDTVLFRTSFTKDADGSRNLDGGWFDCGDHVTFGQTFFFSACVLAKAYDLFPLGFHDLYCGNDYADYVASKNWDMSGGQPDGIPDLLQELKYATDWMIKATPDGSTFYYQKGEGARDHKAWVTAGKMSTQPADFGGEPRKVFRNPNDCVMPSLAAATLAIMSRVYKKYDEAYSAECLIHAKNAFAYAKSRKGQAAGAGDGGFYSAHAQPANIALITGASELYAATGENGYKSDAVAEQDVIKYHNWGFDYSNSHDLAPLCMATSEIDEKRIDLLKTMFVDSYVNSVNGEGVCTKGNSGWGALRYPGNHAFVVAAWAQAKKDTSLNPFVYKQVDYIMGANNARQSFIVGFCSGCSKQVRLPHHRNVFLRDDNPDDSEKAKMVIPRRNEQFGYLVGGTWTSSSYRESVTEYSMTEGGIDYNAGLVGALGYIVSQLDPADTAGMVGIRPCLRKRNTAHAGTPVTIAVHASGITIRGVSGIIITRMNLIDVRGRVVVATFPNSTSIELKNSSVPTGIYTMVIYTHNKLSVFSRNICILSR